MAGAHRPAFLLPNSLPDQRGPRSKVKGEISDDLGLSSSEAVPYELSPLHHCSVELPEDARRRLKRRESIKMLTDETTLTEVSVPKGIYG